MARVNAEAFFVTAAADNGKFTGTNLLFIATAVERSIYFFSTLGRVRTPGAVKRPGGGLHKSADLHIENVNMVWSLSRFKTIRVTKEGYRQGG